MARESIQSSWRCSQLVCQESSGSNYCRQRQPLLACVSKTAVLTPSHIPWHYSLMGGLLMSALPHIITLWSLQRLSFKEKSLCKSCNCTHMRLKWGHFHCLWYIAALCAEATWGSNPSRLMLDDCAAASAPPPNTFICFHPTPLSPALSSGSLVPGHVGACFVLLLCGWCVLPAQSELWNHPQAGVPRPSNRRQLYEKICKGEFHTLAFPH